MLKLPVETDLPLLPWRGVRSCDIDQKNLCYHRIDADCLRRPWASDPDSNRTCPGVVFRLLSEKFGAPRMNGDCHPSMRKLVSLIERSGARAEYEALDNGVNVFFIFDVSSKEDRAYYVLRTLDHGQRIAVFVSCSLATLEVIENVERLDEALYALIKLCNVPELNSWT